MRTMHESRDPRRPVGEDGRGAAGALTGGKGGWRMKLPHALAILAVAAALGCDADYVRDSDAPVTLIVAAINEGLILDSDVRLGVDSTIICPDVVPVSLAVRVKNPTAPIDVVTNHILVQRYEVRFFRTDGRGIEGVDVPHRFGGALSSSVDAEDSGTSDVTVEVVRRQAKLEPPLSTITGFSLMTMFAEITVYGQTIAGKAVSGSGTMQVTFADFGDAETGCPATTTAGASGGQS